MQNSDCVAGTSFQIKNCSHQGHAFFSLVAMIITINKKYGGRLEKIIKANWMWHGKE